mmetsp:Transcript_70063/g.111189  ORF Transcript_70063/g.111189 Transcript_70063/m.111189 type:complete len:153 (+) Transcript_70063:52-510(+)
MLMRNPTRIEFKAEDAQEYLKSREKHKKQNTGVLPSIGAFSGASVGSSQSPPHDEGLGLCAGPLAAWPTGAVQAAVTTSAMDSPEGLTPGGSHRMESVADSSPPVSHGEVSPSVYQPQVDQLYAMGFTEEQARQALQVTAGDLEAAADLLLS